jgi:protein-disulfide isomerase
MIRAFFCVAALAILVIAVPCVAQTTPTPAPQQAAVSAEQTQLLKSTEAFIRNLFTWGPDFKLKLGPLGPSPSPDFYTVPLEVTFNERTQSGNVFVSKDGRTFLRGELFDMSVDPFAANRAKLHLEGNPSKGPENARVTLVEFADLECPDCRELHSNLKTIVARYPQIRIVFKEFPLSKHPWAETAAIGARCAFIQSPAAFWKLQDSIFDNQDLVSPENVWQKVTDYARQAGLDTDALKACMTSPEAKQAVDANVAEGVDVGVANTPTVFINGRTIVGADTATLEQFIDFELAAHPK